MAYQMHFELTCADQSPEKMSGKKREKCIESLKRAIRAGRALVELLGLNEVLMGQLYSFQPTRWYMRALYSLGSFHLAHNELDQADVYLKEYLANDIHDKLGARHKQLIVALERVSASKDASSEGEAYEQLKFLLEAKFGEDQGHDDVFCLWNYTRALFSFTKKGANNKSTRLLKKAIEKNPHVPPMLLAWTTINQYQRMM